MGRGAWQTSLGGHKESNTRLRTSTGDTENRASWLIVVPGWELKKKMRQMLVPKANVSKAPEVYSDDFFERRK